MTVKVACRITCSKDCRRSCRERRRRRWRRWRRESRRGDLPPTYSGDLAHESFQRYQSGRGSPRTSGYHRFSGTCSPPHFHVFVRLTGVPETAYLHTQGRPPAGECENNHASRLAVWAGELPFSRAAARGREDNRASRIGGRDARF